MSLVFCDLLPLSSILPRGWLINFENREYNMVRFRDGKPTGIYFSQHSDGSAYDWSDQALTIENERVMFPGDASSTLGL